MMIIINIIIKCHASLAIDNISKRHLGSRKIKKELGSFYIMISAVPKKILFKKFGSRTIHLGFPS